ncbi:MAG: hypothetical protein RL391_725 [Actinomycetota bacterium]|jgi:hypothetical protein
MATPRAKWQASSFALYRARRRIVFLWLETDPEHRVPPAGVPEPVAPAEAHVEVVRVDRDRRTADRRPAATVDRPGSVAVPMAGAPRVEKVEVRGGATDEEILGANGVPEVAPMVVERKAVVLMVVYPMTDVLTVEVPTVDALIVDVLMVLARTVDPRKVEERMVGATMVDERMVDATMRDAPMVADGTTNVPMANSVGRTDPVVRTVRDAQWKVEVVAMHRDRARGGATEMTDPRERGETADPLANSNVKSASHRPKPNADVRRYGRVEPAKFVRVSSRPRSIVSRNAGSTKARFARRQSPPPNGHGRVVHDDKRICRSTPR